MRSVIRVRGDAFMPRIIAALRRFVLVGTALSVGGCSSFNSLGNTFFGGPAAVSGASVVTGFIGGVAADEPRAATIARDVLAHGGNAADAAVALGFALSVTLPSRASLGAGGACLAYDPPAKGPGLGKPEAILFTSLPSHAAGGDRPASLPMLARGLYALYARYGSRPFGELVIPAEQMARFGVPVSRAFAQDLALVGGPLLADPAARSIFGPAGTPLAEGQMMVQPGLAATLAQIRVAGVGDLYQGQLARTLVDASQQAGGPLGASDLRGALPRVSGALIMRAGNNSVGFLPPPADGGLAALAAFAMLRRNPRDPAAAAARALQVASLWRAGGGDPMAVANSTATAAPLPPLPASTSFVVVDRSGDAVACATSMNNLFGTGRVAPGTGIVLAASPPVDQRPLLAAAIAYNPALHTFRAAVSGSGQEGAPMAVAVGLQNALATTQPMPVPVPDPGRANVISCPRYLPGARQLCGWATDPRGAGLALGP